MSTNEAIIRQRRLSKIVLGTTLGVCAFIIISFISYNSITHYSEVSERRTKLKQIMANHPNLIRDVYAYIEASHEAKEEIKKKFKHPDIIKIEQITQSAPNMTVNYTIANNVWGFLDGIDIVDGPMQISETTHKDLEFGVFKMKDGSSLDYVTHIEFTPGSKPLFKITFRLEEPLKL